MRNRSYRILQIITQILRLRFSWMSFDTWPWAHLKKFSIAIHNYIKSQILLSNLRMHTQFIENFSSDAKISLNALSIFTNICRFALSINRILCSQRKFSVSFVLYHIFIVKYHIFVWAEKINFIKDNRFAFEK